MAGLICHTKDRVGSSVGNSCVAGAANWVYWSGSRGSTREGSFLLVVGAANLATAVGCSFGTGDGSSCVAQEDLNEKP